MEITYKIGKELQYENHLWICTNQGATTDNADGSYIFCIVFNGDLWVFDPDGGLKGKTYFQLMKFLENTKGMSKKIYYSRTTLLRKEDRQTLGVICVELMRYFSFLSSQELEEKLTATKDTKLMITKIKAFELCGFEAGSLFSGSVLLGNLIGHIKSIGSKEDMFIRSVNRATYGAIVGNIRKSHWNSIKKEAGDKGSTEMWRHVLKGKNVAELMGRALRGETIEKLKKTEIYKALIAGKLWTAASEQEGKKIAKSWDAMNAQQQKDPEKKVENKEKTLLVLKNIGNIDRIDRAALLGDLISTLSHRSILDNGIFLKAKIDALLVGVRKAGSRDNTWVINTCVWLNQESIGGDNIVQQMLFQKDIELGKLCFDLLKALIEKGYVSEVAKVMFHENKMTINLPMLVAGVDGQPSQHCVDTLCKLVEHTSVNDTIMKLTIGLIKEKKFISLIKNHHKGIKLCKLFELICLPRMGKKIDSNGLYTGQIKQKVETALETALARVQKYADFFKKSLKEKEVSLKRIRYEIKNLKTGDDQIQKINNNLIKIKKSISTCAPYKHLFLSQFQEINRLLEIVEQEYSFVPLFILFNNTSNEKEEVVDYRPH